MSRRKRHDNKRRHRQKNQPAVEDERPEHGDIAGGAPVHRIASLVIPGGARPRPVVDVAQITNLRYLPER